MKFVTAIYSKLYGTEYGGRLNRDRHYLYSIKALLSMGEHIICYTSSEELPWLQQELSNFSNIELRVYDLKNYEYHDKIQEIKALNQERYSQDAVWTYRCVELMWLKLKWLHEESLLSNGKVFWIDAGLSHGGIIPTKYNIHKNKTLSYEESFENNLAFNGQFIKKIDKLSDDKFFSFYCNHRQHQHAKLFENDENLPGSIVAGLMGGNTSSIEQVVEKFNSIIFKIIDANDLIQEEMALTIVYRDNPELFNVYNFDTWYHIDWDCFDPTQISFSSFFEDLHEWV